MPKQREDRSVNAVERTLTIFDAFLKADGFLSLTELEERTGLFKSVILRYMISLEAAGYILKREDGRYQLGPKVFALGRHYERQFDIGEYVSPILGRLTGECGESSAFYVRQGDARVCLRRVESQQHLRASVPEGTILALDGSSTAQVLLAFAGRTVPSWRPEDCIRVSSGIASEDDPSRQHICSLAAPVFRAGGELVGALMIAGPIVRFDPMAEAMQRLLADAGKELSQRLGWSA